MLATIPVCTPIPLSGGVTVPHLVQDRHARDGIYNLTFRMERVLHIYNLYPDAAGPNDTVAIVSAARFVTAHGGGFIRVRITENVTFSGESGDQRVAR